MREEDGRAGLEVRLDLPLVDALLHMVGQEDRDELRALDGGRESAFTVSPASSAAAHESLPRRRPTSTSTPESRRFSACA